MEGRISKDSWTYFKTHTPTLKCEWELSRERKREEHPEQRENHVMEAIERGADEDVVCVYVHTHTHIYTHTYICI